MSEERETGREGATKKKARQPNLDDPNDPHYAHSATSPTPPLNYPSDKEEIPQQGTAKNRLQTKDSHPSSSKRPRPKEHIDDIPKSPQRSKKRARHHHEHSHRSRRHGSHSRHKSDSRSSTHHHRHRRSRSRSPISGSDASRSRSHSLSSSGTDSGNESSDHANSKTPLPAAWYKKVPKEDVESSWIEQESGHGNRRKHLVNGKEVAWRTKIEKLKTREEKSQYIKRHGHWFGRLHRIQFNPYSTNTALIKQRDLTTFARPFSQPGRGGNNLQNAIGLKDDRDMYIDIRSDSRQLLNKFVDLSADKRLNWVDIGSKDKATLHAAILKKYPFLTHFRDADGDSWAVKMIVQSYLGGNKSHKKRRTGSSQPKAKRKEQDNEEKSDNAGTEKDLQAPSEPNQSDREQDDPDTIPKLPAKLDRHALAKEAAQRKRAMLQVEKEAEREARRAEQEREEQTAARATHKVKEKKSTTTKDKAASTKGKGKASDVDVAAPQAIERMLESEAGPSRIKVGAPARRSTRSHKAIVTPPE